MKKIIYIFLIIFILIPVIFFSIRYYKRYYIPQTQPYFIYQAKNYSVGKKINSKKEAYEELKKLGLGITGLSSEGYDKYKNLQLDEISFKEVSVIERREAGSGSYNTKGQIKMYVGNTGYGIDPEGNIYQDSGIRRVD